MDSVGPYLSLVVVTKHDTNPGLFNTKFRLSFGRQPNAPPTLTEEQANTLIIGRSSSCNMILDYRTVSTIHAQITYQVRPIVWQVLISFDTWVTGWFILHD